MERRGRGAGRGLSFAVDWVVTTAVECPHCGEAFDLEIDTSQGNYQTVEDCTVCCRPIQFVFSTRPGEVDSVDIQPL